MCCIDQNGKIPFGAPRTGTSILRCHHDDQRNLVELPVERRDDGKDAGLSGRPRRSARVSREPCVRRSRPAAPLHRPPNAAQPPREFSESARLGNRSDRDQDTACPFTSSWCLVSGISRRRSRYTIRNSSAKSARSNLFLSVYESATSPGSSGSRGASSGAMIIPAFRCSWTNFRTSATCPFPPQSRVLNPQPSAPARSRHLYQPARLRARRSPPRRTTRS